MVNTREADYFGTTEPAGNPTGSDTQEDVSGNAPMGDNPFFPAESQNVVSEEGNDSLESDPAAQAASAPTDPTFDTAADAAAGIDVNSPEYKHFQAAFTRSTQRVKSTLEVELDRRLKTLEQQQKFAAAEKAPSEGDAGAPPNLYNVTWDNFQVAPLGQDSVLSGNEAEIMAVVKPMIEHVLSTVNQTVRRNEQEVRTTQVKTYLTQVATEIDKIAPEKHGAFLDLMVANVAFAKTNPVEFANYAVNKLGIDPTAGSTPTPTRPGATARPGVTPAHLAAAQRPSPRPAASSQNKPPVFSGRTSTERTAAAVQYALEQQMRR